MGLTLPVPERVDFRLTKNLESALGCFKAYGLFKYYMIELSKIFADNSELLISVIDSFIYDLLKDSSND